MKTDNFIQRARQKVDEALVAERAYCVALTKSKYRPNGETYGAMYAADKAFAAARRAVRALYKKAGLPAPKMPTIYMTEIALNDLEKRLLLW